MFENLFQKYVDPNYSLHIVDIIVVVIILNYGIYYL